MKVGRNSLERPVPLREAMGGRSGSHNTMAVFQSAVTTASQGPAEYPRHDAEPTTGGRPFGAKDYQAMYPNHSPFITCPIDMKSSFALTDKLTDSRTPVPESINSEHMKDTVFSHGQAFMAASPSSSTILSWAMANAPTQETIDAESCSCISTETPCPDAASSQYCSHSAYFGFFY